MEIPLPRIALSATVGQVLPITTAMPLNIREK
jgi:hypothetical protein